MTDVIGYFAVAAIVIALAVIIRFARRKEEKKALGHDRMNFTVRPPKTIRIVSIVCSAIFGIVFIMLLLPSDGEENIIIILLALGFAAAAACGLYYSFRWKLVVREDELLLTPLFGKEQKYSVSDVTSIETKSVYFVQIYKDNKVLFSAPGLSQGGVMLVSYFIEKGVKAPEKINELDGNWY